MIAPPSNCHVAQHYCSSNRPARIAYLTALNTPALVAVTPADRLNRAARVFGPFWSNRCARRHTCAATTVRSAPMPYWRLKSVASSRTVIPSENAGISLSAGCFGAVCIVQRPCAQSTGHRQKFGSRRGINRYPSRSFVLRLLSRRVGPAAFGGSLVSAISSFGGSTVRLGKRDTRPRSAPAP